MLKKIIAFEDYDGNKREEDFYFNLSKAELIEMYASVSGGFDNELKALVSAQNQPELMKRFKKIIMESYGVKSADGRRFVKSKDLSEEFEQTEAYTNLLMELLSSPDAAAAFINGIMPKELEQLANQQKTADFVANK